LRRWFISIGGLALSLLACQVYLYGKRPAAPGVPVVATCKDLGPGVRRIGTFGFQFDVPVQDLVTSQFDADQPPVYGFRVKSRSSASFLDISWGTPEVGMDSMKPHADPALTFSGPAVTRKILNDEGTIVGEDTWGYWGKGEVWRRVRLRGSIVARYGSPDSMGLSSYGSVHEEDARFFDQVISSACLAPSTP
jgi:hypothetical protein